MMQRIATVAIILVVATAILSFIEEATTMAAHAAAPPKNGWCYDRRGHHPSAVILRCFDNRRTCEITLLADPRHVETHCFKK